ncbi:MAG: hypothetical protein ACJAZA_000667, partial [Shewanella psychromarinicola]
KAEFVTWQCPQQTKKVSSMHPKKRNIHSALIKN